MAVLIYVTAPNREEALRIGRTVVGERLAACANVVDGMTSVYWWEGKLDESSECVLLLKTRDDLAERAMSRVAELHSYSCPCAVALPIAAGLPGFLAWIERETAAG